MDATIQSHYANASHTANKSFNRSKTSLNYSDFWQKAEENRYAIIPMLLVVIACLGGLAGAITINESAIKLGVVAMSTSFVEAFILAVLPMRTIILASVASLLLSLLMVII